MEPQPSRAVTLSINKQEAFMDKDRIDGAGKVTGDRKLQAEGKADKAVGKVQGEVGKAKDAVRDAARR
jgi:uncharacterized protein YjbJ (UPF0337 family)